MKPQVKQKLKIFYSLTMCFISLFCIVTCSLAWFARNENVNGTGMSVTVQKSGGLLGVEFFVEDKNVESGFLRAADQNSVTLGKYDLLTNDYRILVKVYVENTFEADSLKFVARTSTDYFLGDGNHNLLPVLNADNVTSAGYTNALSSVVGFYALQSADFTSSGNGCTVNGLATIEKNLKNFIVDTETTNGDGTTTTTTSVSSSVNVGTAYLSDDTYTASDGTTTNCKSMFLLVTYDKGLMTRVFTANLGNKNITNVDAVPFAYDFTLSIEPTNA